MSSPTAPTSAPAANAVAAFLNRATLRELIPLALLAGLLALAAMAAGLSLTPHSWGPQFAAGLSWLGQSHLLLYASCALTCIAFWRNLFVANVGGQALIQMRAMPQGLRRAREGHGRLTGLAWPSYSWAVALGLLQCAIALGIALPYPPANGTALFWESCAALCLPLVAACSPAPMSLLMPEMRELITVANRNSVWARMGFRWIHSLRYVSGSEAPKIVTGMFYLGEGAAIH